MGHGDQHVGDNAGDQLVDPRLNARAGHDQAAPLHAAPVGRVALEQQMRDAVCSIVVAAGPELQSLASSDVVEWMLELLRIAAAFFVEKHRLERIVRPVWVVFVVVIGHAGYEDHHVAVLALRLEALLQAEERTLSEDGVEGRNDRGPRHRYGQELRGEQFRIVGQLSLLG